MSLQQQQHGSGLLSAHDAELLKPFMWDVDISIVDLRKHARFIIERLLRFGRPPEIRWVCEHFPEDEIREVVKKSKTIDRKTAAFWSVHLDIPRAQIACFNRSFLSPCFY